MANFEDFISHPWKITDWTIQGQGKIPVHGFGRGHHLKIEAGSGVPLFADLTWKDGNGEECSLLALAFKEENGTLHDTKIEVRFARNPLILAEVTLSIDEQGVLRGKFGPPKSAEHSGFLEGNTGTFAADADPPRDDHGASRSGRQRRSLVPV